MHDDGIRRSSKLKMQLVDEEDMEAPERRTESEQGFVPRYYSGRFWSEREFGETNLRRPEKAKVSCSGLECTLKR